MWYCVDKWSRGFCAELYGLGVWLTYVFGVCMGYAGFQCVPWVCCAGWITLCRNLATSNWTLTTPLCILSWWMRWVLTIAIRHHNCQDLGTADWTLTTPLCILSWWMRWVLTIAIRHHNCQDLSTSNWTLTTPLCILSWWTGEYCHNHQVSQLSGPKYFKLNTDHTPLHLVLVDRWILP